MSVAQTLQIWRSIVLDMHIKHNTFILYVLLRICFVSFLSCPCQRVWSMRHSSKIIYSHGRILLTYLGDLPLDSGWMTLQSYLLPSSLLGADDVSQIAFSFFVRKRNPVI